MINTIVITLIVYWTVGLFLAIIYDNVLNQNVDDFMRLWAFGIAHPVLWVLCYPIRAWHSYSQYKQHYQKRGISWLQYLFGRRVLASSMNPIARKIWKVEEENI